MHPLSPVAQLKFPAVVEMVHIEVCIKSPDVLQKCKLYPPEQVWWRVEGWPLVLRCALRNTATLIIEVFFSDIPPTHQRQRRLEQGYYSSLVASADWILGLFALVFGTTKLGEMKWRYTSSMLLLLGKNDHVGKSTCHLFRKCSRKLWNFASNSFCVN